MSEIWPLVPSEWSKYFCGFVENTDGTNDKHTTSKSSEIYVEVIYYNVGSKPEIQFYPEESGVLIQDSLNVYIEQIGSNFEYMVILNSISSCI